MRLHRFRQLTSHELRWRAATMFRSTTQHLASRIRPPRWSRADIADVLRPEVVPDEVRLAAEAAKALPSRAARHWQVVHDALIARLRSRTARFVLNPSSLPCIRDEVLTWAPGAADDARAGADRILRGEYDILGYKDVRFARDGQSTDWHFDPVNGRQSPRVFYTRVPYLNPAVGDHKVIWEINRHQHWLRLGRAAWLTGDAKYARAILDELRSWLAANPPLVGINWASMLEIGFRAISWTWALHSLLAIDDSDLHVTDAPGVSDAWIPEAEYRLPDPWLVDMLVALARQLTHVEQNLSHYFSPNTHLTGEALALYVVGTALPELAGAARWAALGRRILIDEIDRQILSDGGHAERSTHYQRYTLDFYLLALLTSRIAADGEAESHFASAVGRLAEFTRVMADDEGRLPLLGDDDGGMLWPIAGRDCRDVRDSLSVAAATLDRPLLAPWGATEETVWIAGPGTAGRVEHSIDSSASTPLGSRALTDTGYFVARDGCGSHAVFDAGSHGYLNGGHAHADALAITLTVGDRPLLIDPGTSTYTMDALRRDRLRSSMSHNTITIDGRSQSSPAGPFHWKSRADARLDAWRHNAAFDWVEGVHDGYAPLQHRRAIVRTAHAGWLIVDEIRGPGTHRAAAHWHFDPEWALHAEPGRIRAAHAGGEAAWLLHEADTECRQGVPVARVAELFHGDHDSGLGWYAPVYGTLVPAPSARVTFEGKTPMQMLTWIGEEPEWSSPSLLRVPVDCDSVGALAAQVTDGDRCACFMLRIGGVTVHAARTCRMLDYETDARLLHYLVDDDRLVSMDLVDVRRVETHRRGWLSIEADDSFSDLHIAIGHRVIEMQASAPSSTLRVRGVPSSHRIRLNGRDLSSRDTSAIDGLLIHPSDWRNAPPAAPPRLWRDSGAAFAQH